MLGLPDFEGTRLRRAGLWVVTFSADWCPFSRHFLRRFEQWAGADHVRAAVGDLTDPETGLWERFEIEVTPTMIVFEDGAPILRRDGILGVGLGDEDLAAVRAAVGGRRTASPHGP